MALRSSQQLQGLLLAFLRRKTTLHFSDLGMRCVWRLLGVWAFRFIMLSETSAETLRTNLHPLQVPNPQTLKLLHLKQTPKPYVSSEQIRNFRAPSRGFGFQESPLGLLDLRFRILGRSSALAPFSATP